MIQIFLKQRGSQLNYNKRRTKEFTNGSDFSFVVHILCLMPTTAVVFLLPPCNITVFLTSILVLRNGRLHHWPAIHTLHC